MDGRMEFREKLSGVLAAAFEQGMRITMDEVEKYFEEDHLSEEQIELVCDYLLSQKVVVSGYEKKCGTVTAAGEEPIFTEDEKEYLREYERDLAALRRAEKEELPELFARAAKKEEAAKQRLTESYLPVVVEIAKTQRHPEIFLGDIIQEGNLSLITAIEMLDTAENGDEFLRREILQGIQALQETLEEEKKRDHRMVEKVSELDESITKLTEEMGRKITIEELSMFMDLPVDEIVSVMQLAGEDVEVGEVDPDEIFHVAGKDEMKETDQTVEEDSRENAQKMLENYAEKLTDGFDDMEYRPGE